jgi:hypothetical protein
MHHIMLTWGHQLKAEVGVKGTGAGRRVRVIGEGRVVRKERDANFQSGQEQILGRIFIGESHLVPSG